MKVKGYIAVLILLAGFAPAQQQTLYTNYLMNQYLYNPAYAGVEDGTQFSLGYRNQWVGFDGAPTSYLASGYGKLKKKPNMAVGGLVMTERIGLLQRTSFYATYSYHLKINKKAAINFGIGAGGIQQRVRVYDAKPYDKDDNFLGSDVLRATAFDANAGFYFYTKNFFLGFSEQQMPDSKIPWDHSTGRNTNHFYAYTGYNFNLNKDWTIQPSILARTSNPAPYLLEYSAKVIYSQMFWAGFTYRQQASSCFMIGCKIDKQYTFAYSYDIAMTALSNYSSGSHEILLSYLIPFKRKKSKSEQVQDADEEELNKIDNTLKTNLRNKKKKENEKKTNEEKPGDAQPNKATEPGAGSENKTGTDGSGNETPKASEVQPDAARPEQGTTVTPAEPPAPAVETPATGTEAPKASETQPDTKQPETEPKKEEPKH